MSDLERMRRVQADNAVRDPNHDLDAAIAHAKLRLDNALRIGRPGHIERCRLRLEGLEARTREATA